MPAVTELAGDLHAIEGDPQIVAGAVANLLQNAFKLTLPGGHVSLTASVICAESKFRSRTSAEASRRARRENSSAPFASAPRIQAASVLVCSSAARESKPAAE